MSYRINDRGGVGTVRQIVHDRLEGVVERARKRGEELKRKRAEFYARHGGAAAYNKGAGNGKG